MNTMYTEWDPKCQPKAQTSKSTGLLMRAINHWNEHISDGAPDTL